jgi:hypothetical protein
LAPGITARGVPRCIAGSLASSIVSPEEVVLQKQKSQQEDVHGASSRRYRAKKTETKNASTPASAVRWPPLAAAGLVGWCAPGRQKKKKG